METTRSYDIPFKGLSEGKHEFGYDLGDAFFRSFENPDILSGRVHVDVLLTKSATLLELDFRITGEVGVQCDRCLEECRLPVDYEGGFKVRFAETREDFDGELMWLSHGESSLDVGQYIYESVVLSLPYRKVHPDNADGKPGCNSEGLDGVRMISEEEFAKAEQASEMQKMADNPEWQKLAALKDKLEGDGE